MSRFPEIKPSAFDAGELEHTVLDWWAQEKIFERQLDLRPEAPRFTFYEGPPTANGRPGVHHVLARTIKDSFCRYKAMCGYQVQRKAGWDTHGLPVEIEVEKKLGLKNRAEIEAYGIAEYNQACRDSVNQYTGLWNELTTRIGYWVDLENPYVTYENNYIESVWWLLKELANKDLLYRGYKIHWYSPGTGTVLSSHEVSLGYKEVDDPSVTARFPVDGEENTFFLAWTTTPWTLPSNLLLSVGPTLDYVTVQVKDEDGRVGEKLIMAKALAASVMGKREYEVIAEHKGRELIGMRYTPVFDWFAGHPGAFRVVGADYITTEDGTGIVHTAPAFGADDYATGQREGVEMVNPVERDGHFAADVPLVGGQWFKDADAPIIRDLKERGLLFERQQYTHNYPHDWRKGTPLMSYPVESWFVRTTKFKDRLVELNNTINWQPEHVGRGRFGEWLSNNVDWALSRHRFWGTPLPIWVNDKNEDDYIVIGSIEDLKTHVPADQWPGDESLDLHRPMVDDFSWPATDGGTYRRVPEIIDVWFDSGAMPFAQWHYPFENKEQFEQSFPADFIAEGLDQTRGWFYTLHAIATLVKDSVAYKNVVVNGLLLDEKGEKMSKSKGNTVDPFEAVAEHGADALRWYLMAASPPWENVKYADAGVLETRRKLFMTLVNVYGFFATYANIDGVDPAFGAPEPHQRPELDRWLLSRLQTTITICRESMDAYNPTRAARAIETLVDDLSNWYIRRSRPVFWAGKKDTGVGEGDKRSVYATTYEVLLDISKLMAPIAPFFAEWLHRNLLRNDRPEASVHLANYPEPDGSLHDATLEQRIGLARRVVSNALQLRNLNKLNVRQPLSRVMVVTEPGVSAADLALVEKLILEEVNVDALETVEAGSGVVTRSAKPNFRVVGKKAGPRMKLVAAACAAIDDAAIQSYTDTGALTLTLADGSEFTLDEGDLLIESQGMDGWAVAREDGVTVALDTQLDDALIARGLAREVINRIQNERKRRDLDVVARIRVTYAAEPKLSVAIHAHRDLIMRETLAVALESGEAADGAAFDLDGATLRLEIQLAS
ncbi:MAG: isoleucine--tRNA ligase [Oceanococcaceae bacterium]